VESSYYGSKDWANSVLKIAIAEVKNSQRVLSARQLEVFYFLDELRKYGWSWQVARLRNQINLAVKNGSFTSRRLDPLKREGELS
jgi:hypothetical protein